MSEGCFDSRIQEDGVSERLDVPLIYGPEEAFTTSGGEAIEVLVPPSLFYCPQCRRVLEGFVSAGPRAHWMVTCRGAEGHAWREAKTA